MITLAYILIATLAVSLVSFVSIVTFVASKSVIDRLLMLLVALSGGALMGGAFLHLLPESVEEAERADVSLVVIFAYALVGFCLFLLTEQFLNWHHHHHLHQDHAEDHKIDQKHPVSYLILFGDGVHNLIDGLTIAASFMVSTEIGVISTLAVALHEIPQEFGDFGVLVYSGYSRSKALIFNFLSGLTAIAGGIIGYVIADWTDSAILFLLPLAAGGFIYIAASDLVPEIKHGEKGRKMFVRFTVFLLGIGLMAAFKLLPFGEH